MTIDELAGWLASDEAGEGHLVGCTDEEIREVCAAQVVRHLPEDYRAFLALAGRAAREFDLGIEMVYPSLLDAKNWMQETLRECGNPFSLPPRSFVFVAHGGYHHWFFEDAHDDVPLVSRWLEGEREPLRLFRTFTDWAAAWVAQIRSMREREREYTARGILPPPSGFRMEDHRTI